MQYQNIWTNDLEDGMTTLDKTLNLKNTCQLNLIAIVALVYAFAVCAVVAEQVFAQNNSTSSGASFGSSSNMTVEGSNMTGMNMISMSSGSNSSSFALSQ